LSPHLKLFADDVAQHTAAIVGEQADPAYARRLESVGGRLLRIPEVDGHLDLKALLHRLGRDGGRDGLPMQSLLVEAGPGLATALLRQDLVDRFFLFVAPKLVGEGIPVLRDLGITRMADAQAFAEHTWETIEGDLLFRGYRRPV
jgi:diaminohydroxyphosphoribosylaminopyrimidine deaminase/5-amino-6-(5-phosphoribosylamino)uracil reductase